MDSDKLVLHYRFPDFGRKDILLPCHKEREMLNEEKKHFLFLIRTHVKMC